MINVSVSHSEPGRENNAKTVLIYLTTSDQLPSLFSHFWYDKIALHFELEGNEDLDLQLQ